MAIETRKVRHVEDETHSGILTSSLIQPLPAKRKPPFGTSLDTGSGRGRFARPGFVAAKQPAAENG
jgi:hypothetical protein